IFEDKRNPNAIFYNTRIVRNTELLLYALRLYERLGVDPTSTFVIELSYGGLSNRILIHSNPTSYISIPKQCSHDTIVTDYTGSLIEIEPNLTKIVAALTSPMFDLFDFSEFPESMYQEIISAFIDGRVLS
ncbi:MAG: hypothetical protein OXC65_15710, partial [Thiotrichales bacterium]|nr:hypothetical protein [Thiotrichales bacterium]